MLLLSTCTIHRTQGTKHHCKQCQHFYCRNIATLQAVQTLKLYYFLQYIAETISTYKLHMNSKTNYPFHYTFIFVSDILFHSKAHLTLQSTTLDVFVHDKKFSGSREHCHNLPCYIIYKQISILCPFYYHLTWLYSSNFIIYIGRFRTFYRLHLEDL